MYAEQLHVALVGGAFIKAIAPGGLLSNRLNDEGMFSAFYSDVGARVVIKVVNYRRSCDNE